MISNLHQGPVAQPDGNHFFATRGFLLLHQFATPAQVEALRTAYDAAVGSRRDALVWIPRPESVVPALAANPVFDKARDLGVRLLGVPQAAVEASSRIFFKPPRYGCETPWHQDEAYRASGPRSLSLNIWIPLDPATAESGCLHYIPGSHLRGVLPHRPADGFPGGYTLMAEGVDRDAAIACPLEPGDAAIHHCRMLHYSGPNTTGRPRRAFVVVVAVLASEEVPWPWRTEGLSQLQKLAGPGDSES